MQIDEQLYSYFKNTADTEDIRRIESWLEEDSAHQKDFDVAHDVYNAMEVHTCNYVPEVRTEAPRRKRAYGGWKKFTYAFAAAALFVLAGFSGSYISDRRHENYLASHTNVLEVPAGQKISVSLGDGTRVSLNGGSRLEYPAVFTGKERSVRLSGEAFFEVSHDEEHPFFVRTYGNEVKVLGTEFNVFADERNGYFSTTLLKGKVRVSGVEGSMGDSVVLSPGEMATRVGGHLRVTNVAASDVASWREGYINVGGVPFRELMHRFENAYGVKIRLERDDITGYMGGKIKVSEGIDFALHLLQQSCDFKYEKGEDGVIAIY